MEAILMWPLSLAHSQPATALSITSAGVLKLSCVIFNKIKQCVSACDVPPADLEPSAAHTTHSQRHFPVLDHELRPDGP